ncbi:MAG TPA: hypothetical protein VL123_04040 [Candidatus Udaeobacter sp.]|jgi:mono/diheme cytochrome c family protein|nr:hypothetical protein [Candidatus Udaeobacter sp.]
MKPLRWLMRIVGILALLIVIIALTLIIQGRALATRAMPNPVPKLAVAADTSLVPRGTHIVEIVCSGCHTPAPHDQMALSGGSENFFAIPKGPTLGTLYAPNVTPGGVIQGQSDGQLSRAIREGVSHDGRPLLVMPSDLFHTLSDRDLSAVIAYLRSQPAVTRTVPAKSLNPLGYLMLGLRVFSTSVTNPIPHPIPDVPADSNAAYGAYVTGIIGCTACHGSDLHGGTRGQLPPVGPNLVQFTHVQPFTTFELALRHGVNAAGGVLDPTLMPWPTYAHLTDLEARAVYEFIRSKP